MKRALFCSEKSKRGCAYCADAIFGIVRLDSGKKSVPQYCETAKYCPYAKCPYHELDGYKSYEAYLKKHGKEYTVKKMIRDAVRAMNIRK